MKHAWLSLIALPALACGSSSGPEDSTRAVKGPPAPAPAFENQGGMWMPEQLAEHAETLKNLGLEIDVATLANPLEAPLAAIVSLGGCSSSFVSATGLMVTNHHCVQGSLQYHSTPEHNYVRDGFLAKTLADEKWNGPGAKVWVTEAITDVTDKVLGGLDNIDDGKARYDEIEKREKGLIAACEKDRPSTRCRVASYFRGAEFKLIESMEIKDVRMVYAPHQGVGVFGGDEDNWMWPRHTGDFSFYRAYVGPDGKPADYSKDNVPYQPKHFLKVASKPLRQGDLVMVAGYPGRTYRHRTAAEVKDAVEWSYPRKIKRYDEYLAAIRSVTDTDEAAKIKATSMLAGLANARKNNEGMLEGLSKGGLAAKKSELETQLRAWIAEDEARNAKYGQVFAEMDALHAEVIKNRERDSGLGELGWGRLLGTASTIVQMAEERPKLDKDREPYFQERQWSRIEAGFKTLDRKYHPKLDITLLGLGIERAMRSEANAEWLTMLFGKAKMERAEIDATLAKMYEKSKLADEKTRLELLKTATTKALSKSKDPFIRLALKLRPLEKQIEDHDKMLSGKIALIKPKYLAALREYTDGPLAPDANSTLRVTFGTVRGYKPTPESPVYKPFTVMSEVVAKHKGAFPFNVPEAQRKAVEAGSFGAYVDDELGEVPVNFLSDVDTTGGNSGSATLNAKGELVGLLFDGNYESMASDYVFIPEVTRSIHCDARYMFWIMDAVDGADRLLEEMGVTPSL
jgi:hypothetical protein